MSSSEARSEIVLELAEEFLDRYRKGERPPLKEYIDRHPELASEIKEVFPAMAMMEKIAVADESVEAGQTSEVSKTSEVLLKQLGDYRIIREIGHGGMGVVYEAEQLSLARHVALKVLPNQAMQDAKHKRRFEREAKAAAKLHHTNIVPVFGVGEHEGLPYYVMQFIQGLGLDAVLDELNRMRPGAAHAPSGLPTAGAIRIARRDVSAAAVACSLMTGEFQEPDADAEADEANARPVAIATEDRPAGGRRQVQSPAPAPSGSGRLSDSFTISSSSITLPGLSGTGQKTARKPTYWQSVANIGRQVADALEYAHKQGVLHRDVKPSNLLLDLRGTAWVTDFGLAKVAGPGAADGENITHTGDVLGTLRYMPPEAFDGKSDARSDVYSLGLTLYELLALRPAFDERDRNKLIKQVTTGEPAALDTLSREAPPDLVTIVHKAIEREPSRRYATAEDLASDLQRFLDDEPILARRQTQLERYGRWARHNPGIAVLGAVLTAVLVLVTLGSLIVASRMSTLAENETQAAVDERAARQEAEGAKNREARQRTQAVQAKRQSDENRKRAEAALKKAEESFAKARAAVNDYLTAVSDDPRLKEPGLSPLRAQLLQSALGFYQEFLKERADDPTLRRELAAVYYKVGQIYTDLGRFGPAKQSYAQSRRLYEALAAHTPDDPVIEDGLAKALVRQGQYDRAIAIWERLIRPADPRYHADLAWAYNSVSIGAKKDTAKELEFLRKALATRERLVKLRPGDPEARMGLGASLNNIAVALGSAHLDEQIVLYRRAAGEAEVAYKLRPHDTVIIRGLVILTGNVANMAKRLGRSDEAVAASRRVIEVLDRQARANPDAPGLAGAQKAGYETLAAEMVTYHLMLAAYLRELGRLDEAAHVARQGRDWAAEVTTDKRPFFSALAGLHLEARAVAEARVKGTPDARSDVESASSAAVAALRNYVLTGFRGLSWLKTNPLPAPLRKRADYQELIARVETLTKAEQVARNAQSPAAEKVTARQECLAALEALAGPLPTGRFVRRSLAQARQGLAQALLDTGRVPDARLAFAEALAVRQRLVEEAPSDEQLRADLASSQSTVGDLFAAAGKLADAGRTWNRALATLEEGLKKNSNSIPFQAALSQRLIHVADQYGKVGLWDIAAKHYQRVFEVQPPADLRYWYFVANVMLERGDTRGYRSLTNRIVARLAAAKGVALLHSARIVLLAPDAAARYPEALRRAQGVNYQERDWPAWCQGMAAIRQGQAEKGLPLLEQVKDPLQKLPAQALALHQLGRTAAAKEALQQADLLADQRLRDGLSREKLKVPDAWWSDWLVFRSLRREAHQAIHGKPMPESPYDRLFHGRVLNALDEPEKAEAEFVAAVALRPNDADVWLTRASIYARLGRKDRMAADLLRAQRVKGDDPRPWVETGRLLAERGEHKQADAAFARACALGKGELNRFLESGWWVVGPYPGKLDSACPPELAADPSKSVAAVGENRDLKWQRRNTTIHTGAVGPGPASAGPDDVSYYFLTYVHADRDRTANLHFRTWDDARLWVNGRLMFDGFAAWGVGKEQDVRVPAALRAGRNTLLVKVRHTKKWSWFECLFHDAPALRALDLYYVGLWPEAADAFAAADRRSPLDAWRMARWVRCLRAGNREDEARRVFGAMVRRHDRSGGDDFSEQIALADPLPPQKSDNRERWVRRQQREAQKEPNASYQHFWLGYAYYRAARFAEAEKCFRRALELSDELHYRTYLAMSRQQQGQPGEARQMLQRVEKAYAQKLKEVLQTEEYKLPLSGEAQAVFLAAIREARTLIHAQDPGPDPSMQPLVARARKRLAQLAKAEDHFARLVDQHPDQPRLWVDRGRRLGELQRWDEVANAFAKAAKLAPKDAQVWKERGRAYADLGKWDEAAADFVKALKLAPTTKSDWLAGSVRIHDQVVRLEEVFSRVAKLRPTDRQLWIQRVHYLGRTAQWPEAAKTIARVVELDPEDHLSWHFQATLLATAGDLEGYRKVCRAMLARFGGSGNAVVAQRVATACLIAPNGTEDPSALVLMMKRAKTENPYASWNDTTLALGHYRAGQWDQALKVLAPLSNVSWDHDVVALAIRAMAQLKLKQPEAARQTLQQAREGLARFALPGKGELQTTWFNWHVALLVLHEAEALIPAAPVVAGNRGSTAQEYAAQRDRKARADRLATEFALALIRVNVGPKAEAEAELRSVLGRRVKLAGEEPANPDYRSDIFASRVQLGRFLADSGRIDEGKKELTEAVAAGQKLVTERPADRRARLDLAAAHRALAGVAWKTNRPADAVRAQRLEIALLCAVLKESLEDKTVGALVATAESNLGNHYASLTLWTEAGELLARAVRRSGGGADAWRWLRAGQASLAAGNVAEVGKLAAEAFARFRTVTDSNQLTALVELMALTDSPKESLTHMIPLTEQTARNNSKAGYLTIIMGIYEYRSGQLGQAVQRLEAPERRNEPWSKAFLAMAHHRLGHAQKARKWLGRAEESYTSGLRIRMEQSDLALGPIWWTTVNELIFYREARELITGKPMPLDPLERLCLVRSYLYLGESAKAQAEFKAVVQARPDDPMVWLARGRGYIAAGQPVQATADFAKAETLAKQALAKKPDDANAANTLADILLGRVGGGWRVLRPSSAKSEGGATLTIQPDASVLADGTNPDRDSYAVNAQVEGRIGAIRLEVLPDPSMPAGGCGRSFNGNFLLTDFRLMAGESVVTWSRAYADFSQENFSGKFAVAFAIDADETTGWSIWPRVAEPHWAVFIPSRPIAMAGKTPLTIRLAFRNKVHVKHAVGRFRLSVTGEPDAVLFARLPAATETPHARLGAAYLAIGDAHRAVEHLTKIAAADKSAPAANGLVLALAHQRLGEKDTARVAYRQAVAAMKPVGDNAFLLELVHEVLRAFGPDGPEAEKLLAAAAGAPPAALAEAIQEQPDQAAGYLARGDWYGRRGVWRKAAVDYAAAYRLEPRAFTGLVLGTLLARIGEVDRYREQCKALLDRFAGTTDNSQAHQTLKTCCLLGAGPVGDKSRVAQLARLAKVAMSGDPAQRWYEWLLLGNGLYEYRAGRFNGAVKACRAARSNAKDGNVYALAAAANTVEAMALHRSGNTDGAHRLLAEARKLIDERCLALLGGDLGELWHDWPAAQLLYREAADLIAGKKAAKKTELAK